MRCALFDQALRCTPPPAPRSSSLNPDWAGLSRIGDWWTQPIVKTEGHRLHVAVRRFGFWPDPASWIKVLATIGASHWLRPTPRLPAWPDKVPFTCADTRTVVDVALYAIVLIGGCGRCCHPARQGKAGSPPATSA